VYVGLCHFISIKELGLIIANWPLASGRPRCGASFSRGFLTNVLKPKLRCFSWRFCRICLSDAPSKPLAFLVLGAISIQRHDLNLLVAWSTARTAAGSGGQRSIQTVVQSPASGSLFVFVGIRACNCPRSLAARDAPPRSPLMANGTFAKEALMAKGTLIANGTPHRQRKQGTPMQ